jgi:hypothetical protein
MRAVAKRRVVRFGSTFLLCACITSAAPAAYREVWVVNEGTRDVAVIDPAIDAVVERISLGPNDPETPRPWGIAFSTIPGRAGDYAFVTQGSWIRIIDTATRTVVSTFHVVSSPTTSITLRGCAAARPERFLAGNGEVAWKSYLHVAAAAVETDGRTQPWYVVLDQEALIDPPPDASPVVGSGPMLAYLPPGGMEGEAIDVMVLGAPAGRQQQRAWYSLRFLPTSEEDPTRLVSALVTRPPQLWFPWTVDRLWVADVEEDLPITTILGPGVPFDRELPVFPERSLGTLRNVGSGGACGEVGEELVSVTVAGPGPLSYTVLAVDQGPPAALVRLNPKTCGISARQATGQGPTDVAILGRIDPERAYVANHDEDTVTRVLVTEQAPWIFDPLTIPLDPGGEPVSPCVQCPRSVGVVATAVDSCNIHDLRVEVKGGDLLLQWGAVGCEGYAVWAICRDGGVNCLPPPWPPPVATIQPWEPALYEGGEPWDGPDFVEARPITLDWGPAGVKGSNGWRILGKPSDPWYEHDGAGLYFDGDATWYTVLPVDPTLSCE